MNVRHLVLKALIRFEDTDAYSDKLLDSVLSDAALDRRDRAFASTLFYGCIEKKLTLDYIIKSFSSNKDTRLKRVVKLNLRMAVYQILFMSKVPHSAAVNEALKLLDAEKKSFAKSFTNAILRNIVRALPLDLDFPEIENEDERLSVKYSFPVDLVRFFKKSCDCDIEELLSGLSSLPPASIRINTLKTDKENLISLLEADGVTVSDGIAENSLRIENYGNLHNIKSFNDGLFHVQDESSQITAGLLGAKSGDRVLDICAAPGGKTFTIAENMQNNGEIIANDIYENKLKTIEMGAKRLGIDIIKTTCHDASKPFDEGKFDRILCDLPCSGLGIIRKKPEIKYKKLDTLDFFPNLQYLILCNAVSSLKNNGILVYSTCTLNKEENGGVVARFLQNHKNFKKISEKTFYPHTDNTDGFFAAVFQKTEN